MAYTDEQKSRHISELQRYLYSISHYNEKIPRIFPDGVYGPETVQAVKMFQKEYDLPVTGEIDSNTWEKLVETYLFFNKEAILLEVFPTSFVLKPGSTGTIVYIIQIILNTLSKRFENIKPVEVNGVYNTETQNAVNSFKELSGTDNGVEGMDTDTWNKLASGFNMMDKTGK